MSPVSRQAYHVKRDRREVWVAVAAAALIVVVTALGVWILAPGSTHQSPSPSVVKLTTPDTGSSSGTTAPSAATGATGG